MTERADMPSGSLTYHFTPFVTVQSGTDLLEPCGDAVLDADFSGSQTAHLSLAKLDSTVVRGTAAPVAASDVADILVVGSLIQDLALPDGGAVVSSSEIGVGSGASVDLRGAFFGSSANEAGGLLIKKDRALRDSVIYADFLVD